jgi:3-(3-hydroxy-phenyl)propionate hydroxylase
MSDRFRVLIVGAGPVGTATGLKLASEGVPVTLFDLLPEPADDHRAATLQPSTLDFLAELGVTPRILEQGLKSPIFQWHDLVTKEIVEFDYGLLADETKHPYVIQLEQHRTVNAMLEIAQKLPDFQLVRPVAVTEVRQSSNHVEADVTMADGSQETVAGSYLVGSDGGGSLVRKTMDVSFEGFTWPERFNIIATHFDLASLGFRYRNYCPHPERWTSFMKVPGEHFEGLWRCVFPAFPEESDELVQSDDWIASRFKERFDAFVPDIVHRNMYKIHQRVAGSFRDGRMMLAGDAAHINNPVGGIGMNSGIQDGLNLAAKLVQIRDGAEPDLLLDRYDRQRRETAIEFVQAQSIASKRTLEEKDSAARRSNFEALRRIADDTESARDYVRRSSLLAMWTKSEAIA